MFWVCETIWLSFYFVFWINSLEVKKHLLCDFSVIFMSFEIWQHIFYGGIVYMCLKGTIHFSIMLSSRAGTRFVLFRWTMHLAVCCLFDLPFNKDDFLNVWFHIFIIIHLFILPLLFLGVLAMYTLRHPRLWSKILSSSFAQFPLFSQVHAPSLFWVLEIFLSDI